MVVTPILGGSRKLEGRFQTIDFIKICGRGCVWYLSCVLRQVVCLEYLQMRLTVFSFGFAKTE